MARDDNGGSVVAAFLIGAITGAAVALLLAPASGEEVRRMLGDRAREGRDRANDAAQKGRDLFERGRDAYQRARGREDVKEPV